MNEVHNFGPIVFKTKVDQYILDRLRMEGDDMVAKDKRNYNTRLAGHLKNQHRFSEQTIQWFYGETYQHFQDYISALERHKGIVSRGRLQYKALWINYMKAGDFNPAHVHSNDISFALFVDVPKKIHEETYTHEADSPVPGHISFFYGEDNNYSISSMAFAPQTGDIYIFPAKLRHFVAPFRSDVTRISCSGNLDYK